MEKKILIISAFLPSRRAGGTIFTQSLIQDLRKDFFVDVIVVTTEQEHYDTINDLSLRVFRISKFWMYVKTIFFFFLNPLFIRRFSVAVMLHIRRQIRMNNYDLIFFDYSQTFFYSLFVRAKKNIFNYHDVMIQKFLREKFPVSLLSIPSYIIEYIFSKKKDFISFVPTKKDAVILKSYYKQNSKVINYYLNDFVLSLDERSFISEGIKYFIFLGDWSREENREGLDWFLKNVDVNQIKDYKFFIIGKNLEGYLKDRALKFSNFEYLGFVENPYVLISNATAVIAPLFRGAGIKIKVIESLACGTPVLGTEIAFEGLPDEFKEYMVLCKSVKDYVESIKNTYYNVEKKKQIRKDFIEYYNNNSAGSYLRELLMKLYLY